MEGYTLSIFLTGTTGFLGGKLLTNLLQTTNHTLFVLVRDREKAQRLVERLPEDAKDRVHLINGNITKPNCGLTADEINTLTGKVKIFYHLAALVKFDEALREELFSVNYDGTLNALELAKTIAVKKFFYISTAYTIGKHEHGIEKLYPIEADGHNPYEESKVKSEHLAFSYKDDMDVSIFRPSIIVGDDQTGEADSAFTLYGFMRALDVFKRRVARNASQTVYRVHGSKSATSNFVPVNYVADILAHAESNAKPNTIYNITNPKAAVNFDILSLIKETINFSELDIIEEVQPGMLTPEEERLNAMIEVFNAYVGRSFNFDDTNTQALIENSTIKHLDMSDETLKMIINAYTKMKTN